MDFRRFLPSFLRPIRRSALRQRQVNEETRHLALYQSPLCGYCVSVKREIRRLDLQIELRNIVGQEMWRDNLRREGGRLQVPCLQITHPERTEWLYESTEIIRYLRRRFAS